MEMPSNVENPVDYVKAKEAAREVLKLNGLGLKGLLSGKDNIDPSEYPTGEFVSKNGILIFSTPEGVFARKSDTQIQYQLEQAGFKMNEELEVPDLNNPEVFPKSSTNAQADWAHAQYEKYEGASA